MSTPSIPSGLVRHPATLAFSDLREALDDWRTAHAGEVGGDASYDLADTVKTCVDFLGPRSDIPPRVVPSCAYDSCGTDAAVVIEDTVQGQRTLNFACDSHLRQVQQSWSPATDPAFGKLNLAGMTTLPAYQVVPGMQTWTEVSPLWPDLAWSYVVMRTEVYRTQEGALRVRWTYENTTTREFGFDEPVIGYFQTPEPQAVQDLTNEPN